MIDLEEKIGEYSEFAHLLEKNSFFDLKKRLQEIRVTNYPKYKRFYEDILDLSLWGKVNEHKLSLAIFIAKQSGVVALPEDRTRIVFHLAKAAGKSLDEINKSFKAEFGDYFVILPSYKTPTKILDIKEITKRAVEIRNGIRNICYLEIEDTCREIMIYFKGNTVIDKDELTHLQEATFKLMTKMRDAIAFINPSFYKEVKPELIEYYKLLDRTQLDIESLEDPDFDEIAKFVYTQAEIIATKLKLINKGHSPNDLIRAEQIVRNSLASINYNEKVSVEEIERTGMPLPKVTN